MSFYFFVLISILVALLHSDLDGVSSGACHGQRTTTCYHPHSEGCGKVKFSQVSVWGCYPCSLVLSLWFFLVGTPAPGSRSLLGEGVPPHPASIGYPLPNRIEVPPPPTARGRMCGMGGVPLAFMQENFFVLILLWDKYSENCHLWTRALATDIHPFHLFTERLSHTRGSRSSLGVFPKVLTELFPQYLTTGRSPGS